MIRRLFLIYALVELAAIVALVSTIGWGWTLLALLVSFVLGVLVWAPIAGVQLGAQLVQLRSGLKEPRSALGDGAMVTLASILVLVPGLVSTTLGILLLAPPIRNVARPALTAIALRRFEKRVPLIADPGMFGPAAYSATYSAAPEGPEYRGNGDYIDGEVIDVRDVEPAALPSAPAQNAQSPRQ